MPHISQEDIPKLIAYLKTVPLGGLEAQFKLAPQFRQTYDLEHIKKQNPKQAGVAVILFNDAKKLRMVLTKRANYSGHHASQISFPGGKRQKSDASLLQTAIRETHEEIGVNLPEKHYLRQLTDLYIPVSDFLVTPFLFYVPTPLDFTTNYEVEQVLAPQWHSLMSLSNRTTRKVISGLKKISLKSPGIDYKNEFIWGATAMIMSELYEVTQNFHKQN